MFTRLKNRFTDMRTITKLCQDAERHANQDGEREPGLEHFVLAACDLPDGSAKEALARFGKTPGDFRQAVTQQYADALAHVGIAAPDLAAAPVAPIKGPYRAKPQVGELMNRLCEPDRAGAPVRGADVLAAVACFEQGVAARSFARMGIGLAELAGCNAAGSTK